MLVVTGPSGNVGTELVRQLIDRQDTPFRIAAHTPSKIAERYGSGVPHRKFDFADRATWAPTLDGATSLFLLFPLPHPRTAKQQMAPFVQFAADAGIEHIIYISVPGAEKYPFIPHNTVEKAIRESGTDYTILQATYFSQNLTRTISSHIVDIALAGEIFIPAGQGKTSFIDSRDVAEAVINIVHDPAPHKKRTYVVSGPEALAYDQAAQIMSAELGRKITYADPNPIAFWSRLRKRNVPSDVLFFMELVYGLTRFGKNAVMTDELERLLGRPPRRFADYVRDYKDQWTPENVASLEAVRTPGFLGRKLGKPHAS